MATGSSMSDASKKVAHEAFVSGHSGCGVLELMLHLAQPCLIVCLADQLRNGRLACCHGNNKYYAAAFALAEAGVQCLFAVLQLTILSDWMLPTVCVLAALLVFVTLVTSGLGRRVTASPAATDAAAAAAAAPGDPSLQDDEIRRLFKDFQALLLLQTSVAILAVDFPAMPRRLAKTETWGVSPMDIGAPAFAFSSGLFAASCHGNAKVWRRSLASSVPLGLLGLCRTLAVKSADYQEHVTEYGVHCNFFLTLACLRAAWPLVSRWPARSALALALFHLCLALPHLGGAAFLLRSPELDRQLLQPGTTITTAGVLWWIFAANREGIVSLPPYLCLYCAGAALASGAAGRWRLPLPLILAAGALLPPAVVGIVDAPPPSRRLFNASFLSLCLSSCCLVLLLLWLGRAAFRRGWNSGNSSSGSSGYIPSSLLGDISSCALPFFLLSNLLTGAVNLALDTVGVTNDLIAASILGVYLSVLVACLPVLKTLNKFKSVHSNTGGAGKRD